MTVQEAMDEVFGEMGKLTPEQLHADLEAHKNGELAIALRETSDFIGEFLKIEAQNQERDVQKDTS